MLMSRLAAGERLQVVMNSSVYNCSQVKLGTSYCTNGKSVFHTTHTKKVNEHKMVTVFANIQNTGKKLS